MILKDVVKKWKEVLEHSDMPSINSTMKKEVTAVLLENTLNEMQSGKMPNMGILSEAGPTNSAGTGGFTNAAAAGGPVAGYDPVMISLVRRAMPNLVAYDVAGVQPMTGPTGLIFALRAKYTNQAGAEALYNEPNSAFSGKGSQVGETGDAVGDPLVFDHGTGLNTEELERLGGGGAGDGEFAEMSFGLEKVSVTANGRALKAEFSHELEHDLKSVHGLDARRELSNLMAVELLAEQNRELVRTIYRSAKAGSQTGVVTAGTFDLDVDSSGRWMVEKFKGLMFQVEREANQIARDTRRGKGNILICSSDIASALQMAGILDHTPALAANNLNPDDTQNTYLGVLNGRFKVYLDPYAGSQYMVVGYKGSNVFDAGIFYCPYVPLQSYSAIGENNFQPRIGFKTRYGLVANPFAQGATPSSGWTATNGLDDSSNVYYRRTRVSNIL